MLISLPINYYANGYAVADGASCVDLPIAVASGLYDYENYYYFLFYHVIENNWGNHSNDWFYKLNYILNKMGLVLKANEVDTSDKLISLIKQNIDNQCPIILPVNYSSLFYSGNYLEFDGSHSFIISAYDTDKPIIGIIDSNFADHGLKLVNEGYTLYKLYIKHDMIVDIWSYSNAIFSKNKSFFNNKLFSIEKFDQTSITGYNAIILDFLKNYSADKSNFADIIMNNNTIENKNADIVFEGLRRTFYGPIKLLFDIFEKASISLDDSKKKLTLEKFKSEYMDYRNGVISKLQADILRGKKLDKVTIQNLANNIILKDRELFLHVKDYMGLLN
ncbi:MAG: hypothetical protein FIA99_01735 [Ruminiclostridium sp.]|nr:hypothetical protein [Ruminiclostridium sp.]